MKAMKNPKLLLLGALLAATGAQARVYECRVGGVTVYTSRPSANCQTPDLPRLGMYTSLPAPKRVAPPPANTAAVQQAKARTSGGVARVSAPIRTAPPMQADGTVAEETPKAGGNAGRKAILEQELANERKALAMAQNELSAARAQKNVSRAGQLTASIQDRQQNIQALQRELGRM
ncbi:MAG: hypothetical protein Q3966_06185 [Neisseria sp.]|nr:hypothetical protein [Neisseria sp.]